MGNLLQQFNEWEIQLLVLLSFTLQVFLFFTGNLRQRSTNMLLRGTIWIAYLGADFVAIYALGFLSRHEEATIDERGTHPLAFFWAPFLLIHLGGQDTITAFAMEDNSLWLRHLLNLLVQVGLSLFVFWKSTSWRNVHLLVSGIFLFVAGIIKYVERTLALMHGNLSNARVSIDEETKKIVLPELIGNDSYRGLVCFALRSVPAIRYLFTGRSMLEQDRPAMELLQTDGNLGERQLPKLLDVELAIMYYDLYTKAALLRTRSGIILRCISQVSFMVALVLFAISDRQQYHSTADIAITYVLFIGGFLLEVCATLVMFMVCAPWTWAWLEARDYPRLARMSWFLLSSDIIGWPQGKPLWSKRIGQYSLMNYMGFETPTSLSQRAMSIIRKVAKAVGVEERKLFWLSKLLDTKYEEVDVNITECIVKGILQYSVRSSGRRQLWPYFGALLESTTVDNLGASLFIFHVYTEIYLSNFNHSMDAETVALVDVCRKLSNYMFYILFALPAGSNLHVPITKLDAFVEDQDENDLRDKDAFLWSALARIKTMSKTALPEPWRFPSTGDGNLLESNLPETNLPGSNIILEMFNFQLQELRDIWVTFLIYAAGKSRPEMHAAELSRGGELLTFVWLLMAHNKLGESGYFSIELTDAPANPHHYAFHLARD